MCIRRITSISLSIRISSRRTSRVRIRMSRDRGCSRRMHTRVNHIISIISIIIIVISST